MSLFEPDRSADRMPVSVVTGFLGSGKTTLLNHLLRDPAMSDSAVIINEFGEVSLDHHLIESVEGDVAVLASGCVCCTMRSDLESALRDLLARRDRGETPPFRRVLVETTGLADPAPILQILLNNPLLGRFVRLDAVATTVDAVHCERQLDAHDEAVKQVALADILLLTKLDLAAEAGELRARLRRINPGAEVRDAPFGAVPAEALFGLGMLEREKGKRDLPSGGGEDHAHGGHGHHHDHVHAHHGDEVRHDGVRTITITADAPLHWAAVSNWLSRLRGWHGEHLLRVKGILELQGEDGPVAIHGVHHVFHPPVRLARWPDRERRSRIVFITRGLDPQEIAASWDEHVAAAEFAA